jgi:glycosyltransferase involved in cell wall biosynthesis
MEDIRRHLEIIVITYNRSLFLDKTLNSLAKSPFATCNITILNNASTDNTLDVCNKYKNIFSCLNTITHKINIGGNANILRAVEISNGKYTWILADDDEYDFADCDDIFNVIVEGKVDLIHVGAHTDVPWDWGRRLDTPRNLLRDGYLFFRSSSFIPCNIFKTASFYPYVISGYDNVTNFYPHMPFLMSFYENDKNIYVSKKQIVKAVMGNQGYSPESFFVGWTNTACLFHVRSDRILFFQNQFLMDALLKRWFFPVSILATFIYLAIEHPFVKFIDIYGIPRFLIAIFLFPLSIVYKLFKKIRNHSFYLVSVYKVRRWQA